MRPSALSPLSQRHEYWRRLMASDVRNKAKSKTTHLMPKPIFWGATHMALSTIALGNNNFVVLVGVDVFTLSSLDFIFV
jgi:hypothetical protein